MLKPCLTSSEEIHNKLDNIRINMWIIPKNYKLSAFAQATVASKEDLVAKMEEGKLGAAPIWTDLKTLPAHVFRDAVDLLTGGYPCQPFSAAGKRQGADDPRHLWPHICRIIDEVRPRRCFFENVEGHISLGLREVIADLEARGYSTTWGIFSASEVGAPHQRKRVFILADSRLQRQKERQEQTKGIEQCCTRTDWPARPGQEQHDWEQSRTIEPGLGRATYGTANRVDRLRLLGNGVCPDSAALAWRTLNA